MPFVGVYTLGVFLLPAFPQLALLRFRADRNHSLVIARHRRLREAQGRNALRLLRPMDCPRVQHTYSPRYASGLDI